MNPKITQKKGKRFCACCSKSDDFDSNEVIFEYFGKEFKEYEYVIENLAIRPAPKKLLDLVPVHSTNISKKSIYKIPTMKPHTGETLHSPPSPVMIPGSKLPPNEYGDCQKPVSKFIEKIKEADDFVSLKILPDEAEPRMCGPCNPQSANYDPCSKYPYDQKPCGSCLVESLPEKCKPLDTETVSNVLNLRRSIKSRKYRTTKQILSDLCEASEQSLHIKLKNTKVSNKPMPIEIQDTIETLRFKKPLPQFFTRTEKRPFHKPGVYFVNTVEETHNTTNKTVEQQKIDGQTKSAKLNSQLGQHDFIAPHEIQFFNAQTEELSLSYQSEQQRLSNQSGQPRLSDQLGKPRLSGQSEQPRLSSQSGQSKQSGQLEQQRLSAQLGQSTTISQSKQQRISGQLPPSIPLQQSDTTINDLSEHMYKYNNSESKMPGIDSIAQTDISKLCQCECPKTQKNLKWKRPGIDSIAQTDISKPCLCPKAKKNLKWKIIINKHSNCEC